MNNRKMSEFAYEWSLEYSQDKDKVITLITDPGYAYLFTFYYPEYKDKFKDLLLNDNYLDDSLLGIFGFDEELYNE